mmetsp:Transcript_33175/g.70881  ORF Transcript_33175/g.70881 Transcript_33175/m.70881 type:complete len:245 (+) Transcript_33175:264-998(+)
MPRAALRGERAAPRSGSARCGCAALSPARAQDGGSAQLQSPPLRLQDPSALHEAARARRRLLPAELLTHLLYRLRCLLDRRGYRRDPGRAGQLSGRGCRNGARLPQDHDQPGLARRHEAHVPHRLQRWHLGDRVQPAALEEGAAFVESPVPPLLACQVRPGGHHAHGDLTPVRARQHLCAPGPLPRPVLDHREALPRRQGQEPPGPPRLPPPRPVQLHRHLERARGIGHVQVHARLLAEPWSLP